MKQSNDSNCFKELLEACPNLRCHKTTSPLLEALRETKNLSLLLELKKYKPECSQPLARALPLERSCKIADPDIPHGVHATGLTPKWNFVCLDTGVASATRRRHITPRVRLVRETEPNKSDETSTSELKRELLETLKPVFKQYERSLNVTNACVQGLPTMGGTTSAMANNQEDWLKLRYRCETGNGASNFSEKFEFEKYLDEGDDDSLVFEILVCWKKNAPRYPILAAMARDVLAIPVTTVASKSSFRTRGRL